MENPYATPVTPNLTANAIHGGVAPEVIEMLRRTKGWVRFLAVLGFIATGFILLASFGVMIAGSSSGLGEMSFAIGVVYLFMTGIYFYGAYKLNQYASRIGLFLAQPDMARLASALDAQRGLWKFVGIMALVTMVIYLIVIIVVAIGAVAALG